MLGSQCRGQRGGWARCVVERKTLGDRCSRQRLLATVQGMGCVGSGHGEGEQRVDSWLEVHVG